MAVVFSWLGDVAAGVICNPVIDKRRIVVSFIFKLMIVMLCKDIITVKIWQQATSNKQQALMCQRHNG